MSRDGILARVRAHQGELAPLPAVPTAGSAGRDALVARFRAVLEQVGGVWAGRADGDDVATVIRSRYPEVEHIVSTVDEVPSTLAVTADTAPADLVRVELVVARGRLGVAENGAVWIDDGQLPHRALPFVAEHCVLLLATDDVVPDLHAAYAALAGWGYGWGAFVSGPSKTADIEQSLVIGAQGPRTLLVVMTGPV